MHLCAPLFPHKNNATKCIIALTERRQKANRRWIEMKREINEGLIGEICSGDGNAGLTMKLTRHLSEVFRGVLVWWYRREMER